MSSGKESLNQGEGSQVNGMQPEELTQLREDVEELRKQNALLQTQLDDKDALINKLVSKYEIRPVVRVKSFLDMTSEPVELMCVFAI